MWEKDWAYINAELYKRDCYILITFITCGARTGP